MSFTQSRDNEFLDKLTRITEANLSNEQFGASELAREAGLESESANYFPGYIYCLKEEYNKIIFKWEKAVSVNSMIPA
jgi:hypothetical protein